VVAAFEYFFISNRVLVRAVDYFARTSIDSSACEAVGDE
jgi:hypothetical protein